MYLPLLLCFFLKQIKEALTRKGYQPVHTDLQEITREFHRVLHCTNVNLSHEYHPNLKELFL